MSLQAIARNCQGEGRTSGGAASLRARINLVKHMLLRRQGLLENRFGVCDRVKDQSHIRIVARVAGISTASTEDNLSKETSPDRYGLFQTINQTCRPGPGPTERRCDRYGASIGEAVEDTPVEQPGEQEKENR